MRRLNVMVVVLGLLLGAGAVGPTARQATTSPRIPVEYRTLDNGLKVVVSRDTTTPTAVIGVYYKVGFRIEPRDRTGFAHLFEHMMFQASENLGKNEFIRLVQSNGGILNGSTRFDFTNYFEVVPAHTVETVLWAEADRMRGLAVTDENLTNQRDVVKSEVRVNVLNRPYGGFPWLDLPQYAFSNWYNAHNFYGDLEDLDAATLPEVTAFFHEYYAPNNAVVVVVGDVDVEQTFAWVEQYFGPLAAVDLNPAPDVSESPQTEERQASREDPLADRPALALGYRMPDWGTPEYYAMGLIDQILGQGRDAELYRALVQREAVTGSVSTGINYALGNMFNINGPTLWSVSLFHDTTTPADRIVEVIDETIEPLRTAIVDDATLARARVKMRSSLYDEMEYLNGFGTVDLLASFALFHHDPGLINTLDASFAAVTPELIQRTAQEYLRPTNRTVLRLVPGAS